MKKMFAALPLLLLGGCTALNSASTYVQGLITAPPQAVKDVLTQVLNVLMGILNGFVVNFFSHLIPPVQ